MKTPTVVCIRIPVLLALTLLLFPWSAHAQKELGHSGFVVQAFSSTHYTPFIQDHYNSVLEIKGEFSGYGGAIGYEWLDESGGFMVALNVSTCDVANLSQIRGPDSVSFKNVSTTIILSDGGIQFLFSERRVSLGAYLSLGLSISSYDYTSGRPISVYSSPYVTYVDQDGPNSEVFFRGGVGFVGRIFVLQRLAFLFDYRTVWARIVTEAEPTSDPNVYLVDYSEGESSYTDVLSIGLSYTF